MDRVIAEKGRERSSEFAQWIGGVPMLNSPLVTEHRHIKGVLMTDIRRLTGPSQITSQKI